MIVLQPLSIFITGPFTTCDPNENNGAFAEHELRHAADISIIKHVLYFRFSLATFNK
jgi:hypothetical protein